MVGGGEDCDGDCGGYLFIYIYFCSVNYPDCVRCTIINPTTFSLKADFLIS